MQKIAIYFLLLAWQIKTRNILQNWSGDAGMSGSSPLLHLHQLRVSSFLEGLEYIQPETK